MSQFKRNDFFTFVATRPGRHKTVNIPDFFEQVHELNLEARRISAKSIGEHLGISRERVESIIHKDLYMRKLSAKWVPKCLNAVQKRQRSEQIMEFFSARFKGFPVAIGDHGRNLVISLDPETKQKSMEWRHSVSLRPEKFRVQKSVGKVLASIFWDQDGILLID